MTIQPPATPSPADAPTTARMVIGGQSVDAADGATFDVVSPVSGAVIATAPMGGREDVDRAVAAAQAAFEDRKGWATWAAGKRGRILSKFAALIKEHSEELAQLESRNVGKPITGARGEVIGASLVFDYYAGAANKIFGQTIPVTKPGLDLTLREPIGVVGLIVPWNFPLLMASWKVAPALAAGNTAILKPASYSPLTAIRLGELALEAGIPAGVLNVVTGPGGTAGASIAGHPGIGKVAFTGETTTGQEIMRLASGNVKKISLELGGKSPNRIHELWKLVTANSHVIGDFTWTGWDYLGEVGLGRAQYADDLNGGGVMGTYPWLVAHSGDIDITGRRRPASFYREIVFGLRDTPYIAVQRPDSFGRENQSSPWAWTDSLSSWNWSGSEERPVTVEVYSSADEVELLLDDTSLGKKPTGVANAYRAHFDTTYRPGILNAVAYTNGVEMGRESLRTAAGTRTLQASVDRSEVVVGTGDLAYIDLALVDANGTVFTEVSSTLTVRIDGPGHLQGLGNANPRDEESFVASSHNTHDGRALVIVRPTAPGDIIVTVSSDDGMLTSVTLNAVAHRSAL